MERFESPVERAIREAQERGEFDDLPGAGKPLSLGDPEHEDPDWWVKGLVERENLDVSGALSPALALRKEAAGFPESLLDLRSEASVRAVLEDYNHRVKVDRLRPGVGPRPPVWARIVDIDEMVQRWKAMSAECDATPRTKQAGAAQRQSATDPDAPRRGGWLRRHVWPF